MGRLIGVAALVTGVVVARRLARADSAPSLFPADPPFWGSSSE